jgi:hypothetical protein
VDRSQFGRKMVDEHRIILMSKGKSHLRRFSQ